MRILVLLVLSLLLCVPVFAVTVTVSTTGGVGMFNSIQYAIASCLTNPDTPDTVQILDNGPYFEALEIGTSGYNLTIEGSGGSRPLLVSNRSSAITGYWTDNRAIDIRADICTTIIKDIVLIPSVTDPPGAGIDIDDNGISGFNVQLINVVIAGNDGSDQPVTMDGLTVGSAATTFTSHAIDIQSTPAAGNVYLEKVIVSRAALGSNYGLRVLLDGTSGNRAKVNVGPGCVFSYLPVDGIYFGASMYCDATFSGTSTEPIIFTNNARWGIWDYNNTGNSAVNKLNWAIFTNNGSMGLRISGTSNQPTVTMTNCTFANNALSLSTAQIDFSVTTATNFFASNVIIAGNGTLDTTRVNTVLLGTGPLNINTSAIVLQGTYTLNTVGEADGVIGTMVATSITNRNPIFWSLDPSNPKFARVGNAFFATAGPNGGPLTGGGQFEIKTDVVSVSPAIATVPFNGTRLFTASGGIPPYVWSSSDTTVGSIDSTTGLFTALSFGTTIISAIDVDSNTGIATAIIVPTSAPILIESKENNIQRKVVPFTELNF
ncbi:MAG: hypothetical protein ACE14V_07350 [bacterium]